jgi:hypothetical protein
MRPAHPCAQASGLGVLQLPLLVWADPLVGSSVLTHPLDSSREERDEGVPRGPGGPPH